MSAGAAAPLFILSFKHRDALVALAENAGWRPIAGRRGVNAEARFIASGAAVAVIDARAAAEEALAAVRALGDPVEANGGALLALLSRKDAGALDAFLAAGATHFLVSPFADAELVQAILFTQRHADRVAGGGSATRRPEDMRRGHSWRWERGSGTVELSPALARQAGLGEAGGRRISLMELFRKMDADGRRAARAAIDRLIATGEATAFAHGDPTGGTRLAHHLRVSGDAVVGRTETLAGGDHPQFDSRDPMTGLRDGRAARAWIDAALGDGADRPMVALLLAVSRFDTINAAFGRAAGDAVLQAAARRIERLVDPDAKRRLVARIAGAEFAVLLAPPATLAEGRFLAGQLVEAIGRPFMSEDHVITLGCRVGAVASGSGDNAASLLRRASATLADAKAGEGGGIRVMDAGAEAPPLANERLDVDLRRALADDEIEILFQPLVAVTTGRIEGAEALARWRHPILGELGAATLFSVAERSDYLAQLSAHIQQKALRAAAAWPEALGRLRLSVNITAADIVRPGFATEFGAAIAAAGLDPGRVTVEVTESGLIEDLNAAAYLLAQLRETGLRVAIDDFGTGYSSLAYLKALPLDYLKIDKRLSEDITGSPRDRIVVRGVIDMARSLGLGVIAEGVETQEQLDLLAQEGCTLYQGYLCAPPVTSAAFVRLIAMERV